MKLLSVNIGRIANLLVRQHEEMRRIASAIHKSPTPGPVGVGRLGLQGDEQADPSLHGGIDKAIYAYPVEHYSFWNTQRTRTLKREEALSFGAMGENLTVEGLLEQDVWIGDRLQIGSVLLQITEPRQPCYKFNVKMGFSHAAKMMIQAGCTGFYLRVIEPGTLTAGQNIQLLSGRRQVSLTEIIERRRKGHQQDLF